MSRPSPYRRNFLLCPQETKTSSSDWSNCSVKCPHNVMSCHHFRFRRGFKQFFRCCPFVHVGPEVLTRREVVTSRYSCTGSPDHHRIVRNGKSTSKKSFNFEALMTKVSDFLPFSPQIPSARSFIRVRGRRRVIVNHMVSIIAWIYFVHTSRRRQPIGSVRLSPLLRGGDRNFSSDPIPHERVKKSKVFIALKKQRRKKSSEVDWELLSVVSLSIDKRSNSSTRETRKRKINQDASLVRS